METGKKLSLISGIITIVATFFFSWYAIDVLGTTYYANGLGIMNNLVDMFTDAESLGTTLDIPPFAFYIIAGIFIAFLVSGVLQILGMKHRVFVIIGTLLVLLIASLIFLGSADVVNIDNWIINVLGTDTPLIEGIIPLKILEEGMFDIGMYLLYAGGIIGIIASVYGPGAF
ncbi:MAG: hypothetical protein ACFE94_17170 [Candidatus Hodarchaeota archaeon]